MPKGLKVTHALGVDVFGDDPAFDVQEGVLIVFTDSRRMIALKAYNREVWATAEFEDVR